MTLTTEKSGFSEQEILQKQQDIQYSYAGFTRAYDQVRYIMENNSASGINEQELVYETGYEKLFGSSLTGDRLIMSSLCVLVAVYSASAVLGMEYDLKVMNLLRSTKRGRIQLLTKKIGVAFGITFVMAVLIKLPFILNIAKTYPLENWGSKSAFYDICWTVRPKLYDLGICFFDIFFTDYFFVCDCAGNSGNVRTIKRYDFDNYLGNGNLYWTTVHGRKWTL